MRTVACLSTLRTKAPEETRGGTHTAATAPGEPQEANYRVAPAAIGVAIAWLAFFALAVEHALFSEKPDSPKVALMRLK